MMAERKDPSGEMMTQKLSSIYGYQIVYPPDDHAFEFYPYTARLSKPEDVPYGFGEEMREKYAHLEKIASSKSNKRRSKNYRDKIN